MRLDSNLTTALYTSIYLFIYLLTLEITTCIIFTLCHVFLVVICDLNT